MSAIDGARRAVTPAGARSRGGLLQRHEWLRGYLLMSPTMLLMLLMLIVPIIALVIISFWTQDLYSLDTTFTLDNYWHLIAAGQEDDLLVGHPLSPAQSGLCHPAGEVGHPLPDGHRGGDSAGLSHGLFPRLPRHPATRSSG